MQLSKAYSDFCLLLIPSRQPNIWSKSSIRMMPYVPSFYYISFLFSIRYINNHIDDLCHYQLIVFRTTDELGQQ